MADCQVQGEEESPSLWLERAQPDRPILEASCIVHNGTLWAFVQNSWRKYRRDESKSLLGRIMKYSIAEDQWSVV